VGANDVVGGAGETWRQNGAARGYFYFYNFILFFCNLDFKFGFVDVRI